MVRVEDNCCDCETCTHCGYGKYKAYYCDNCELEIDDRVYFVDGKHICEDCLKYFIENRTLDELNDY